MLIVLEGIDGSGKTTQSKLAYSYLKDRKMDCMLTSEATDGPIGSMIKKIVKDKGTADARALQLLFAADRADHIAKLVGPALRLNKTVICDRYIFSTIAYGIASGLEREWLTSINRVFPPPDLTIVFDIDPHLAIERLNERVSQGGKKKTMFENERFLEKARMAYKGLKKQYKNYHIIDGSMDAGSVSADVAKILDMYV